MTKFFLLCIFFCTSCQIIEPDTVENKTNKTTPLQKKKLTTKITYHSPKPTSKINSPTIKILYFGAWESRLLPVLYQNKMRGGFAKFAKLVKDLSNSTTVLCSTGNFLQGNVPDRRPTIKALGLVNLAATSLGNLELNYGVEALKKKINKGNFAVLSANVYYKTNRLFPAHQIINKGDYQIGFIGLTSRNAAVRSNPQAVKDLIFKEPLRELKSVVEEIKEKVDFIVVLSNLSYQEDIQAAKLCPDIGLIIGSPDPPLAKNKHKIGNVFIHRVTRKQGTQLGELVIRFNKGKASIEKNVLHSIIPDELEADKASERLIGEWQKHEKKRSQLLCISEVTLIGDNTIRQQETNLGNLLADIMLAKSQADIAFINSGAVRTSLNSGTIHYGMLVDAFPYRDKVVVIKISGKIIREVLENAVARYEELSGAFLQVAGMSFTFSPKSPRYSRVGSIYIKGESIEDDKIYKAATMEYIATGGDDYIMLKKHLPTWTSKQAFRELIALYFLKFQEIRPALEGRIKILQ